MNKTWGIIIAIVVVVALGAGAYYLLKSPSYNNSTPSSTQNQQNSQNSITIQNFAFSPQTMTVKAGTTVTWTNQDTAAHNIKSSFDFNSKTLNKGDSYQFTFNEKGTFDYICGLHPLRMKAKIIVE